MKKVSAGPMGEAFFKANTLKQASSPVFIIGGGGTMRERGHEYVFHHGALRQEMMALKDETHLSIAQDGKLGVVQTAKFAAVKGECAAGGLIERADQV